MIPGSANPLLLAAADGGYAIERSLRFNSADSAYLSHTPASTGNRKTWTWAGWVKRSSIGTDNYFFGCHAVSNATQSFYFAFGAGGTDAGALSVLSFGNFYRKSTALFRDPSAWYHIVVTLDTTQATATNRIRIYVNGNQLTSFSISSDPAQNADLGINQSSQHVLGNYAVSGGTYFPGYLADIHFIDGQALDPTSFGEFDTTTGVWVPIEYTGSYGTNGFRLDFSDNSAATATTLGKDTSPNGNNWTPNNLSVTAGAGNDSLVDVPTNGAQTDTGVGGEVRGNYCTLNPLDNGGLTLSNGNLQFDRATASWISGRATIGMLSGKWYWEVVQTAGTSMMIGISKGDASQSNYVGAVATGWAYNSGDGNKYNNASNSAYGNTYTTNDVIGIAFDADSGDLKFYKNGTVQNSGTAAYTGLTSGPYFPAVSLYATATAYSNFGQRPFAYTAPSGFKALNTDNLPAPVVTKPSTVMDVALYTGTGSALTPTSSLGFNPDLVWIKGRSGATDHALYDSVRGVEKRLESNTTDAEVTSDGGVTAFNTAGFSVGTLAQVNTSSATYAAWTWDAGSSTVTNTQGSISSQVRANASAGFSVVTYTGTNANATVGHGLGVAPDMVIVKRRNSAANWQVRHTSIAAASSIQLNLTNAAASATTVWNSTAPSSTVFSVGTDATVNASGGTFVAYCFAPVAGYSAFGSYTGNGSADGPFVYTGFKTRWILFKESSASGNSWYIYDSVRGAYNVVTQRLVPDASLAELTNFNTLDMLSNGWKVRDSNSAWNASGATYIYAAFAEHPFQYARAR